MLSVLPNTEVCFLQLGAGQGAYDLSGAGASDTIAFHNPLALPGFGSLVDKPKVPGCSDPQEHGRHGWAPCTAGGAGVPGCPPG